MRLLERTCGPERPVDGAAGSFNSVDYANLWDTNCLLCQRFIGLTVLFCAWSLFVLKERQRYADLLGAIRVQIVIKSFLVYLIDFIICNSQPLKHIKDNPSRVRAALYRFNFLCVCILINEVPLDDGGRAASGRANSIDRKSVV